MRNENSRKRATLKTKTEGTRSHRDIGAVKQGKEKLYNGVRNNVHCRASLGRDQTVFGPPRCSDGNYITLSTPIGFQIDVCKDFKETGYCGYGDSCNFIHDRGG
ncbi:Zinc finger CCCH domain-containing protein 15 [Bienertia sinuspersici]